MTMTRPLITLLFFIVMAVLISGCTFSIGRQQLRLRPATRVPQRSVEQGDGEQVIFEGMDPKGRSMFLVIRGEL